jgi:carboxylate-amine ligase
MPDAATAVHAYNGLREHLALLHALAANSPFRHGRDTALASAREVTMRAWPRSGVPPAFADYGDFCRVAGQLARAADVPDYTWFWWKLRPHPRLGTVEVRALDVQASLQDTAAVAALTHCLARHAADASEPDRSPPHILEEGLFRAARFGVDAELPDADGNLRPLADVLDAALSLARPWAAELGCAAELATVPDLLARGGGAGRQRRLHEIAGMDALLRAMTELTAAEAAG